jgi:hypothetical protein
MGRLTGSAGLFGRAAGFGVRARRESKRGGGDCDSCEAERELGDFESLSFHDFFLSGLFVVLV